MKVTAVLVCHNGSRWLPGVLSGLADSEVAPAAVVAVDTGSTDDSVGLLEDALDAEVLRLPVDTTYAAAVRAALESQPDADAADWIWLLHDDSAPDPACLARLVHAAEHAPDGVGVLGPKLREWPSLRRLLETGVTITGTGRRETGLEPGEYDQGQHDEEREVLAVNTAGMLVRRGVLETLGFDDRLPLFGNDLDFGWRAARAGHRTQVVPDAVMFHVEAAHRGQRDAALAERPRRDERAGAFYTLLVNGSGAAMPLRVVRLVLGGLLRAFGFLLVRAVSEARDEAAAVGRLLTGLGGVRAGRRERQHAASVPEAEVRPLLAPAWLPYRQGLDFLTETGAAIAGITHDEVRRRAGRGDDGQERGLTWLLVRSPGVWAWAAGLLVALVATHDWWFGQPLHGGALLAAPDHVGHWWSTWAAGWHWVGSGSHAAGPAYLFPMALLGTLLLGTPSAVVWLLFLLGVPLTMVGAHHFLRRAAGGAWLPAWGSLAYGLAPVVAGAANGGRLGTVAGAMILPWVAATALRLGDDDLDRRRRATWRTALGTGLLVAFVPPAGLLVVLLVVTARWWSGVRLNGVQLAALIVTPLLMVLPWAVGTLTAPGAWLVEAGRVGALPQTPDWLDLWLGRAGAAVDAPRWLGVGLPVAALAALVRSDTRMRVARVWAVVLAATAVLVLVSRVHVHLPGVGTPFRAWAGFLVIVVQGGFITASAIAARDALGWLARAKVLQACAAVVGVLAVATPLAGAVWWIGHAGDGPVRRHSLGAVPDYMSELAAGRRTGAVLVLKGGEGRAPVSYVVLREGEPRLGDDAVSAMTPPDRRLTSLTQRLLGSPRSSDAAGLASYGVGYVYAPPKVSPAVSSAFDAAPGFSGASAPDKGARAWKVDAPKSLASIHHDSRNWRWALDVVQVLAWVVVVILAVPSRRRR